MLKSSYFFLLVVYNLLSESNSSPIDELAVKLQTLPILDLYSLWFHDNNSVTVGWRPIKQRVLDTVDKQHPLIGIKLQMWEDEKIKIFHFENINGKKIATEKYEYLSKYIHQIPETIPDVATVGANMTSVEFTNIKPNVHYQIRAQVFTDQGLGPYSGPSGFRVHGDENKSEENAELPLPNNKGNMMKSEHDELPPSTTNKEHVTNPDVYEDPPYIKDNIKLPDDD